MKTTSLYIMAVVLLMVGIFLSGCTKKAKNVESVEQVQSQQQEESQSEEQGQSQEEISDTREETDSSVGYVGEIMPSDQPGWMQFVHKELKFKVLFPEAWHAELATSEKPYPMFRLVSDNLRRDENKNVIQGLGVRFNFSPNWGDRKNYEDYTGLAEYAQAGPKQFFGEVELGGKKFLKEIWEGTEFQSDDPAVQVIQTDIIFLYLDPQRKIYFEAHTGGEGRQEALKQLDEIMKKVIFE